MAMTNAERQARWRDRMRDKMATAKFALEAADDGDPLHQIVRLKQDLAREKERSKELRETLKARDAMERIDKNLADHHSTRAMYAEADKERLQAEVDRLTKAAEWMRYVFGELMEESEGVWESVSRRNPAFWEKNFPIIARIGLNAAERMDLAHPVDEDGNDLKTDYVEPSRDDLVDMLCDQYPFKPNHAPQLDQDDDADADAPSPDDDDVLYRDRPLDERIRISVAAGYNDAVRDHIDHPGIDEPLPDMTNRFDVMGMAEMFGKRIAEHRLGQSPRNVT